MAALKHALALGIAAAAAMLAVTGMNMLWEDDIRENRRQYEQTLLAESLQGAVFDEIMRAEDKQLPHQLGAAVVREWWRARKDGVTAAVAVRAEAPGYGGIIVFIAAFNRDGKRLRARVVRHVETPGIAGFLQSTDGGEQAIDGVSGATITSNAMAAAVRDISEWIRYNSDMIFANNEGSQ